MKGWKDERIEKNRERYKYYRKIQGGKMRRGIFILGVLTLSLMLLANGEAKINSTDEKIDSLDRQIAELMERKETLEKLRKTFVERRELANRVAAGEKLEKRPKIGLVLSGGGTNGAAHIGVLKIIEKHNVPIDYIAGTSAGAIIGAMYSIGYSPEEIENIINNINYDKMLTNTISNNLGEFIERSKINKYPLSLTVDDSFNIAVPAGVLTGEYIYLQLKEIFAKADDIEDFSKLPIPIRIMTTDLDTGEGVAIERGDIALALFKSMAIPTLIEPVRDDGKFYVDGGIADNFPVREAIDMGAEIVIGVDISKDQDKVEDQASIVAILMKLSTYNSVKNTMRNNEIADLLIEPDVQVRSIDNFNDFDSLVKVGENSVRGIEYIFENLGDKNDFEEIKTKGKKLDNMKIAIEEVKVKGNRVLTLDTVLSLKPEERGEGEMLDKSSLNRWAGKIYSLDYVSRVFYNVQNGVLEFNVREQVENKVNLGIFYASQYGAGLELSAEMPFYPSAEVVKSYALHGELSKYPKISGKLSSHKNWLGKDFTLLGEGAFETDPIFIYRGKSNTSTYFEKRGRASLSAGTTFVDLFTVSYGLDMKIVDVNYDSGEKIDMMPGLCNRENYLVNSVNFFYKYLDSEFFPTRGGKLKAQIFRENSLGEGKEFWGYSFDSGIYIPILKKWAIDLELKGGEISGNNIPFSERFSVGGLGNDFLRRNFSFVGIPLGGVNTSRFVMGGGALQYKIKPGLFIIGRYNILTLEDDYIFSHRRNLWGDSLVGYGIGAGRDTFLGPIDIFISNNALGSGMLFQFRMGYSF